mgnify:CR=1 FL=1
MRKGHYLNHVLRRYAGEVLKFVGDKRNFSGGLLVVIQKRKNVFPTYLPASATSFHELAKIMIIVFVAYKETQMFCTGMVLSICVFPC